MGTEKKEALSADNAAAEPNTEPEVTAAETAEEAVEKPEDTKWYVIHSYAGYEKKVEKKKEKKTYSRANQRRGCP